MLILVWGVGLLPISMRPAFARLHDGFVSGACSRTRRFSEEPDHSKECLNGAGDDSEQVSQRRP
jgi:hypothetical protein